MKTATGLVKHSNHLALFQRMTVLRRHAGFTLVELIVVMIMIGIMAAVALPRFSNMTLKDVGYRDQAKAAVEFARKAAVARRRYTCVAIATSTVTLTAELVEPQNHAGACPYTALNLPAKTTNVITAPSSVSISPATTIMFDAQGNPTAGTLAATTTFTVTDGGASSTFVVEAGSGYVH